MVKHQAERRGVSRRQQQATGAKGRRCGVRPRHRGPARRTRKYECTSKPRTGLGEVRKKKREESAQHQSEASLSRSTTRKVPEPAQRVASPAEAFTLPHVNVCTGTGCIINAGTTETAYEFALAAGTLVAGYRLATAWSME